MKKPVISIVLILGVMAIPTCAAPILDGTLDASYSLRAVQTVETGFGDNLSELDAAYAQVEGGTLYLMLTGNLENNFNRLNVFIDSVPGGQNKIIPATDERGTNPNNDDWAENYSTPLHLGQGGYGPGFTFDAGFAADYLIILRNGNNPSDRFDIDYAIIGGGASGFEAATEVFGANATQGANVNALPGAGIGVAFNNSNVAGVLAGSGPSNRTAAAAVRTGIELAIPLSALGNPDPQNILVSPHINGYNHDFLSNQSLPGFAPPQDNPGGNNLGDFVGDVSAINLNNYANNQFFRVFPLPPAPFNIFEWKNVDPLDPSQGKQENTVLTVDGYGLHAEPGLVASNKNLAWAYLVGADLRNANFTNSNLTDALLNQANLTDAIFANATLTGADLTDAQARGANFARGNQIGGITTAQLSSTASYQAHDLASINLSGNILPNTNFAGQNFTNVQFSSATLTRANFNQADLTAANLSGANLTGAKLDQAILTNANVQNANLSSTHITLTQLYSTASYKNHDLTGVQFVGNDLSGANLAGQSLASTSFYAAKLVGANLTNADLTNAEFVNADLSQANLTGAILTNGSLALANLSGANLTNANLSGANFIGTNLTGAEIRGANLSQVQIPDFDPYPPQFCGPKGNGVPCEFSKPILIWGIPSPPPQPIGTGITLAQLVSTASYGAGDLSSATLANSHFNGASFAGFNLTNANFDGTTFVGANFSGADARGASGLGGYGSPNLIRPNGHLDGLDLSAGQILLVRDYDGNSSGTIPITVDQRFAMGAGGALRMLLEADAWNSMISFAAGIPVSIGGSLELDFADGTSLASQVGRTFKLFDWSGVAPTGAFHVFSSHTWNLSSLYITGEVTLISAPEPSPVFLLTIGLVAVFATRRTRRPLADLKKRPTILCTLLATTAMLVVPARQSPAAPPTIQLTKIGTPIWKPTDFQLFSAPATPFNQEFGQVHSTLLPLDNPSVTTYVPHAPPYDTELSTGALAGGYVSQSVFTPDQITLHPNGVYFAFMLVPDPGITGSSRDFASGPVIPNSLFPIASNIDVWLDGVLVDRVPSADPLSPVQPRDIGKVGTSHLESLLAIWHPWDDDLTVGPLGNYDLRLSIRDFGGSGWDVLAPFRVVLPGDYDGNGSVDAADYAVWRKNDGTQAGYDTWRSHFGQTAASGSGASADAAVPEPATLVLLLLAAAGSCLRRGRSDRKLRQLINARHWSTNHR